MELEFSSIIIPSESSQKNGFLFASSLREFGGSFSENPLTFYIPKMEKQLDERIIENYNSLNVNLVFFDIDELDMRFPFMGHSYVASLAEKNAERKGTQMAWMAPNSLILKEPKQMKLENGIYLGYRPVHHKLIGSEYSKPLDRFWRTIYEFCGVRDEDVFQMQTHVDDETIRPYFNAGFLIVDPHRELLRNWYSMYSQIYNNEKLSEFYDTDDIYIIFVHQAILSGIILTQLNESEMIKLSSLYNYPIHLHEQDITLEKPALIDDCITVRHEGFYSDKEWKSKIKMSNSLREWLDSKLKIL